MYLINSWLKAGLMVIVVTVCAHAQSPDPDMPRPIDALDSVFLEELTWLEVRDAMRAGKDTVIIATGGIEQNGPYLALGKHNYILRGTTESIARRMGNVLVAPILPFVPEGNIDPPSGHMRYPGTISLQEGTFQQVLTDIASSMKTHGFKHIILIGDSGGNQKGMAAVAEKLSNKWTESGTSIHHVPEYYDYAAVQTWLETEKGIEQVIEGHHDDYGITSLMMAVDQSTVRVDQRIASDKASINGVSIVPVEKTIEVGKALQEWKTGITVDAIRKRISTE